MVTMQSMLPNIWLRCNYCTTIDLPAYSSHHLLFIAKNIERIGDHATNIAENVWFVAHAEVLPEKRAKHDLPAASQPVNDGSVGDG